MSHKSARCMINILATILTICFLFSNSVSAYRQSTDEVALQSLTAKFFNVYEKQDLDALMSLWSEQSTDYATSRQRFQQSFAASRIEIINITMGKLTIDGERANLRVVVDSNAVDIKTGKPATGFGKLNRTLHFVKEDGAWKVSRFVSSEEELAASIAKLEAEEDRNALLEANKDLQTIDLQKALIVQGINWTNRSNYSQKMVIALLALRIAQQLNDKEAIAAAFRNIAYTHRQLGSLAQAIEAYQKSLKISEEINDQAGFSSTLNGLGIVYQYQGKFAQALEYQYKSLKLSEELGDKFGIGTALNSIATTYHFWGNRTLAMEYHQRSLKVREEIGDKPGIASTLNNLGLIYLSQNKYEQALEYYQQSLKIREEIGDKQSVGTALGSLGFVYQKQEKYTQALEYYQRNLKIREEIGDKFGIADALHIIATVYQYQGNYEKALDGFQQSLKIREEVGDEYGISTSLYNIATIKVLQENFLEAREFVSKSIRIASQLGDRELLWQVYLREGQTYRALNRLDLAKQSFTNAIRIIEDLRNQVAGTAQQRQQFFATRLLPYYEMVDLLMAQNNPQEALFFAERSKGRALLDVFDRDKISITKAMSIQEQQQESNLNAELVSLNSQLYREKQDDNPDQIEIAELTIRLEKARLQMETFQINLYATHPELRIQRGEIRPITTIESASLIPDKTAVLEFAVQDKQTYLFVLTKNNKLAEAKPDLQAYKLNIKQKDLTILTQRFNQCISNHNLGFQEPALQLYNQLLKPAQAQLQNINRLVIVPDGVLWELPFQALLSAPRRYLLQDYAISYAPSLTVLREMRSLQAKRQKANVQSKTLLALGNPAIGTKTVERVTAVFMDEKLLPLPEAERQVKVLQQIYGSKNSSVYIGTEADETRLKQEAGKYKILHFATHGIVNNTNPMYSCLVLSQLQNNSSDDGLLEAWEIMKMDLNADLVILSACDTARGKVGAGEGMIGLAWSLFVAGCPTTVVSQWKVETASNTEFMIDFHRNLTSTKEQISKAEALRQAALNLMKNKRYNHPFYWAAFVIIGNANE